MKIASVGPLRVIVRANFIASGTQTRRRMDGRMNGMSSGRCALPIFHRASHRKHTSH
jgi:hypothetical protein